MLQQENHYLLVLFIILFTLVQHIMELSSVTLVDSILKLLLNYFILVDITVL